MKQCMLLIALAVALGIGIAPLPAVSQDTSPYLLGAWETGVYTTTEVYSNTGIFTTTTVYGANTEWQIANPTTKGLDVFAVFYYANGSPFTCTATHIDPNGVGWLQTWWGYEDPYAIGTVKFFSFLCGKRTFDPNAIIGGFQGKAHHIQIVNDGPMPYTTYSKANLKAVTINSYTTGEFTRIPFNQCVWYYGWRGVAD